MAQKADFKSIASSYILHKHLAVKIYSKIFPLIAYDGSVF